MGHAHSDMKKLDPVHLGPLKGALLFRLGAVVCWLACAGDLLVPYVIAQHYPGYDGFERSLSLLGSTGSPVAHWFTLWSVVLFLLLAAFAVALQLAYWPHRRWPHALPLLILLYGIGEGLGSGLFPYDHLPNGELTWTGKVHAVTSAFGTAALFLVPLAALWRSPWKARWNKPIALSVLVVGGLLLLLFGASKVGMIGARGLWQRAFIIVYYLYLSWLALLMWRSGLGEKHEGEHAPHRWPTWNKVQGRRALSIAFGLLGILLALFFFRHEGHDLVELRKAVLNADIPWLLAGLLMTVVYVLAQALLYVYCFRAVNRPIPLGMATVLFLRRNLVSVFLPAGGVTSLAFFNRPLQDRGIPAASIHVASTLYAIAGLLSVVVLASPVLLYLFLVKGLSANEGEAFVLLAVLVLALLALGWAVAREGPMQRWLLKRYPTLLLTREELRQGPAMGRRLLAVVGTALLIDVVGIVHLYIAMQAVGIEGHWSAAVVGYVVAVLLLIVSPFMRGLGAIEVSLVLVLVRFGVDQVMAISGVLIYRFLEFWAPLALGLATYVRSRHHLLWRVLPAVFAFFLGLVNIASAASPALEERLRLLRTLIPQEAIELGTLSVLMGGFMLLVVAVGLLRGLRTAWWLAVVLSAVSALGHLLKGIDLEETLFALLTLLILLRTRKDHVLRSDPRLRTIGFRVLGIALLATLLYGTIGFYFLDARHFGIDFGLRQALFSTLGHFFLIGDPGLHALTPFGNEFLLSLSLVGGLSLLFALLAWSRPWLYAIRYAEADRQRARDQVVRYGRSALDHFKTAPDMLLYFPDQGEGFVSFKVASGFAMVLEEPVAPTDAERENLITLFDGHCRANGLKVVYYRVDAERIAAHQARGQRVLPIGQEAVVDLATFTIEGAAHKGLRNAVNRAEREGVKVVVHGTPVPDGVLQKVKLVSTEWLATGKREAGFSQGRFDLHELRNCTLLTVETPGEEVLAFLNVIPDPVPSEATYDLIRTASEAPGFVVDVLMVKFFEHLKAQGYQQVNLGLAPFSGMEVATNLPEHALKFAYDRLAAFSHYQGLRAFKEKFDPVWHTKYLVYSNDYDLLFIPSALLRVERS